MILTFSAFLVSTASSSFGSSTVCKRSPSKASIDGLYSSFTLIISPQVPVAPSASSEFFGLTSSSPCSFSYPSPRLSQPHSMPVQVLLLLLLRHAQGTPPYLGKEKSYRRPAGVKTTGFSRAFQLPAWVTRPERPKAVKDEVKRPEGPPKGP